MIDVSKLGFWNPAQGYIISEGSVYNHQPQVFQQHFLSDVTLCIYTCMLERLWTNGHAG